MKMLPHHRFDSSDSPIPHNKRRDTTGTDAYSGNMFWEVVPQEISLQDMFPEELIPEEIFR